MPAQVSIDSTCFRVVPWPLCCPCFRSLFFEVRNDTVYAAFQLPEILVKSLSASDSVVTESTVFSFSLFSVFALVSLFFLLLYVSRLIYILILIFSHKKENHAQMTLVKLQNDKIPFSFFHWLFVSDALKADHRFEAVLAHEKAHARRFHSLDVLFMELLQLVFWFNPAWYFMRAELKAMHEYEADALAIGQVNKNTYQKSLLELTTFGGMLWLTNPFNVSLIKKRLLMMNRKKWESACPKMVETADGAAVSGCGYLYTIVQFWYRQSRRNYGKGSRNRQGKHSCA